MPNWLFWIIVWWAASFAALLLWHAKNRSEKVSFLVLLFIALFCWAVPFFTIYYSIRKAIKKDN